MSQKKWLAWVAASLISCCGTIVRGDELAPPLVESYLNSGELAQGETALRARLANQADDAQSQFGLGTLQFLQAVEGLSQSLYRYGLIDHSDRIGVPILRLPVPTNPQPKQIDYQQARGILQNLNDQLAKAEATLAQVSGPVRLPLHFGRIRLDLNGDGRAVQDETLWRLFARLNRGMPTNAAMAEQAEQFLIVFDEADVAWLRGYCHLLMALCEVALAHDGQQLFERTAHLFFMNPQTPYPFLAEGRKVFTFGGDVDIADLIALVHLINLPVTEPKRMTTSLAHLEKVIELSRQNWRELLAETDDDREWIPNPRQTGILPGVRVSEEMVAGWQAFLDEAEAILQGKKLIPFWRGEPGVGVNLRRAFTDPTTFDLVLWIQGTAAAPYLQQGPLSEPGTWRRFNEIFNGQFIGFAIWFN
jgi:hypothetical protein